MSHIVKFHVSATKTALSKDTLGNGVHGDKLNFLAVWRAHLVKDFAHRDKLFALCINILLIHFVSTNENVFVVAQTDD